MTINPLTIFYAKILGILILVVAISFLINPKRAQKVLEEAKESEYLLLLDGSLALLFGSFIILTHNMWDNALAKAVSAIGWLSFAIGIFELVFPKKLVLKTYGKLPKVAYVATPLLFVGVGLFLLYKAFYV